MEAVIEEVLCWVNCDWDDAMVVVVPKRGWNWLSAAERARIPEKMMSNKKDGYWNWNLL